MKKTIKFILTAVVLLSSVTSVARETSSDYMSCYMTKNESYVSIIAIPQAYFASMGRAEVIASRSCDSKNIRTSFGWATEYDCTKASNLLLGVMVQLVRSRACPPGSERLIN